MSKQFALSALALVTLALNACSIEPSDWRPDKKVSLDLVAPGTRSDENFGPETQGTADLVDHGKTESVNPHMPNQAKGGAIEEPVGSGVTLGETNQSKHVTAEESRTANAPDAAQTNSREAIRSVRKPSDTTATKALNGPMQ
ncbi:hypothetical protein CDA63_02190 [Hymenobacter amundsenii]|uniref:Uncharacterized protein n=1 Tax=Hymenobacter amundsenii TaxID=2006685 RepID=A0A246FPH6_9BACT|nr:hypothetical protein [Hymenobacter amundsenii]OWP64589.1 hypothetical protein CDA63_02190 [Hymenobacter amundsenii]